MTGSAAVSQMKVSADSADVVSHAGVGMLRELAGLAGLSSQVTKVLAVTYQGPWIHAPGTRSPIWPLRWPMTPTVLIRPGRCGATARKCLGRWPRRAHCGGWLMNASTPQTDNDIQRFRWGLRE